MNSTLHLSVHLRRIRLPSPSTCQVSIKHPSSNCNRDRDRRKQLRLDEFCTAPQCVLLQQTQLSSSTQPLPLHPHHKDPTSAILGQTQENTCDAGKQIQLILHCTSVYVSVREDLSFDPPAAFTAKIPHLEYPPN